VAASRTPVKTRAPTRSRFGRDDIASHLSPADWRPYAVGPSGVRDWRPGVAGRDVPRGLRAGAV